MYAAFFGLQQEPFSIAPDPRYLFMSERHREALAHLLYGVRGGGGFVLLTGAIGAGKTTVCRCFLEQVPPRCNVAYVFNPKLTVPELLQTVCDEFHIPHPAGEDGHRPTVKAWVDALNDYLLRTHAVGQNNVLIIDEAQNLDADVLEQLRLLTNLETTERKLLQIILIGQPELRTMLARPELEQLAQRVIARYHLEALSDKECRQYVRHRLAVAGLRGQVPFERAALLRLQELTGGVPRRINLLADRALLGAYGQGRSRVNVEILEQAASEVFGTPPPDVQRRQRQQRLAAGAAAGVVLAGGALAWWLMTRPTHPPASSVAAASKGAAPAASAAFRPASEATPEAASAPVAAASAASGAVAVAAVAASPAASAASPPASAPIALDAAPLYQRFPVPWRDEAEAWRQLGALWQQPAVAGEPCAAWSRLPASPRVALCLRGPSSLPQIRTLDRPGIVSLRDGQGGAVYALLTALDADSATLRMGQVSQRVTLASLAALWRGDFATLWRPLEGVPRTGVPDGASGPGTQALAAALARAASEPAPSAASGPARVDAGFKARVQAFQLSHGLRADGSAGPETFMQLNRALGVDEPRLTPAAAAGSRR